jgi:hypothetical protein
MIQNTHVSIHPSEGTSNSDFLPDGKEKTVVPSLEYFRRMDLRSAVHAGTVHVESIFKEEDIKDGRTMYRFVQFAFLPKTQGVHELCMPLLQRDIDIPDERAAALDTMRIEVVGVLRQIRALRNRIADSLNALTAPTIWQQMMRWFQGNTHSAMRRCLEQVEAENVTVQREIHAYHCLYQERVFGSELGICPQPPSSEEVTKFIEETARSIDALKQRVEIVEQKLKR